MFSFSDIVYKGLKVTTRFREKTRRYTTRYEFIDRSKKSQFLVLILAGYQEYIWDDVLGRINKFVPNNYDVCIVSPKIKSEKLKKVCEENNRSYFRSKANKLATALNTAIKLHSNAEYIFKLDEDIFVGKGFFDGLYKTYLKAYADQIYNIGIVCPTMNVNGASYRYFLEKKGLVNEYKQLFGNLKCTCDDDDVYKNPKAAIYLREHSLPLDKTIDEFSSYEIEYEPCPIRYSIGAILFTRDFWDSAKGFISPGNGELARDELCLCSYCINSSKAILISKNIFAGHFGFGVQKKDVIPLYKFRKDEF